MAFTAPTTTDTVDNILIDVHGHDTDLPGDLARQRAKATRNVQRAANYFWHHRDWTWSMDEGEVVVAADDDMTLPTNVQWLAKEGGIWISVPAQRPPLTWIPAHRYYDLVEQRGQSGEPVYYTKIFQGGSKAETQLIFFYPINDATRTFAWTGKVRAPICVDDSGSTDELWKIPQAWRESVIYELAVYYEMKDAANIQGRTEQLAVVQANLENAIIEERPGRNAPHNLAPFGRRRSIRRTG